MRSVFKLVLGLVLLLALCIFIIVQPVYYNRTANIAVHVIPKNLEDHVRMLSQTNPARAGSAANLNITAAYIKRQFERYQGKFGQVSLDKFSVDGETYQNISLLYGDGVKPRIIVGAHYDSFQGLPGADDNASGVAVLIELAKLFTDRDNKNDIELIAYSLEEPPNFGSENMGSYYHAKKLVDNHVPVVIMVSLEMLGYYSNEVGSQSYPFPGMKLIYPEKANYIAMVSDLHSMFKLRQAKVVMQSALDFPVYSFTAPGFLANVNESDHLWFWHKGFPAIMITDTAYYRNTAYHTENDTIDRLDFNKMAKVADGVHEIIVEFDD